MFQKLNFALGATWLAILIWAAQASFAVTLREVPPFLLTGLTLMVGGSLSLPKFRSWTLSIRSVCVGVYGLFVYHFFYFLALRNAPAVEANLVHYLWPALIVLLTPLFSPGQSIRWQHLAGIACGVLGALAAVFHGLGEQGFYSGYVFALAAAFVWASYSLLLRRLGPYTSWTTGAICLISGMLSLLCHAVLEQPVHLSSHDLLFIVCQGVGPMGIAFYLWDYGMRHGDTRVVGILAYSIPVLSTLCLSLVTERAIDLMTGFATILVVTGAIFGILSGRKLEKA